MATMRVLRLVRHGPSRQPVLLLGEVDGDRGLPVFLRGAQAEVIAVGRRGEQDAPLTQDLLLPVVHGLGRRLERVEITALEDGVYRAELVFDAGTRIAALPSDALALAVRDGLPIAVADTVLEQAGQPVSELVPPGADRAPDAQLERFREFIRDVSPDDFQDPPG